MIRTAVAGILLTIGTLLILITGVGMLKLPDVYNRLNAVAKAASLGLICVLVGVLVLRPGPRTAAVVGIAILLQLLTAPVGSYALTRAAYRSGTRLTRLTRHDALARRRLADGPAGAGHPEDPGAP
jgi:multicomponent Na+:H+ antiporter subunit G